MSHAHPMRLGARSPGYRIQLTRHARFRLHALESPVRIVLDMERIDLER